MALCPDDPRGYDGIARALLDLNRNEELLQRLEEPALRFRYSRLLRSVADAARILEARSHKLSKEKVIFLYEEYLKTNDDSAAFHWLGQLYRQTNQDEKAIHSFERAWEIEPGAASSYKAMLNVLRKHQRTSEIEQAKELWRVRNPKRA